MTRRLCLVCVPP